MRRPPALALLVLAIGGVVAVVALAAPAAATLSTVLAARGADLGPTAALAVASVVMMALGGVTMIRARRREGAVKDRR